MTSYPNYPSEETQHFVQKYSEDISTIRWAGVTGSIILTCSTLSQGVGNQVSGGRTFFVATSGVKDIRRTFPSRERIHIRWERKS